MPSPPFRITPVVLDLSINIGEILGRLEGLSATRPQPKLRRENRIRTVQGTVAIEGNRLSTEQITAVLEAKRVLGPRKEVLEVQNAIAAYDRAAQWYPWSQKDLLSAHGLLMKDLLADAGHWRRAGVGVAPPWGQVPRLMANLLEWGEQAEPSLLIKACVVHYEIQFIHPFADGNGRLGRLWQHVVLLRANPLFEFVPVESIVRARQTAYYAALGKSDRAGDCTMFIEFSLSAIRDGLQELLERVQPETETFTTRLETAERQFGARWFSRADYLKLHKRLSTATASRDLKAGVEAGVLTRRGERRMTLYAFRQPQPRKSAGRF